jgi:hypothetical protein
VPDLIRIIDLEHPTMPAELAPMAEGMAALAPDHPLDIEALHRRASDDTGLTDFGAQDYRERLDVLLAALREVPHLTPGGQVSFHLQLVQMLKNRLLLNDLLARHPEIHTIEVARPIIIAGLPRTGTTHLHQLLAADPNLRSLPYWESLEPFPAPGEAGTDPDPRIVRTDGTVAVMNMAIPLFPLMHEMPDAWHVHEEIHLLALDFSTMFFETMALVPAWAAYYTAHDQTPHYRYLKVVLQALQHQRGGRRWVLKSPQHLEQLPAHRAVFPDATYVVTHRDPVAVTVSLAYMLAYTARLHQDPVDAVAIGRFWAGRLESMLNACARDRDVLPASQSIDVVFDEFMRDDLAMVRRICALADHELSPASDAAIAAYLAGHERGRLGRIDYRPEDVGLDADDLRRRFRPYVERFLR